MKTRAEARAITLARQADRAAKAAPGFRFDTGPLTAPMPYGFTGTRRHGNKRSGKGGSSTGGVNGCWRTTPPSYRDTATHDASWSQTVRNVNV